MTVAAAKVGAVSVRSLAAADRARWDEFVTAHDEGTFYHLAGWQDVIGRFLGHPTYYLYTERDGDIDGVLPLARVRSWLFGDALISLPFLVYGGPVAKSPESLQALIDAAAQLADELGVDYLELRNRQRITDWSAKDTYVTFRKALEPDVEANLLAVPRKQRAMIRKGMKAGLEAETDVDAARLAAIMSECKRNLGTPFFSDRYLQTVADTFGDACEILTVIDGAGPVASVMSFRFRDEILPYYGGGNGRARDVAGNDFLYWKVMEKACKDGLRVFDYGRSQAGTGPYRFKKHWGFEPQSLSYEFLPVRKETVPDLNPQNPKYRFLVKAWSRLPLSLSKRLGPPIARRIG